MTQQESKLYLIPNSRIETWFSRDYSGILDDAQGCGCLARGGHSNAGRTLTLAPVTVLSKI